MNGGSVFARQMLARKKARLGGLLAKAPVRGGLVPAREMDTANPLEFGGDRKTTQESSECIERSLAQVSASSAYFIID